MDGLADNYLHMELQHRLANDTAVLRFLGEGAVDGLWYQNLESTDDEWMSPGFWELFGIDPSTQGHRPSQWQDIIFPEDRDLLLANFQRHCADPSHPDDQIVRYRHANGSTIWVRCRGLALRDGDGHPIRMLRVHTDVTTAKRREEELMEVNGRLAEAVARLTDFSELLTHDLRSPLRGIMHIIGFIRAENPTELPAGLDDKLTLIETRVGHMAELIDDTLDYARSTAAHHEVRPVDLQRAVEQLVDMLSWRPGMRIDVDCDVGVIETEVVPLTACVRNLIDNAIKHHPRDDGRVSIGADLDGGILRVVVRDDGAGIAPAHQQLIFQPFRVLARGSSGLGLAAAVKLVDQRQGSIELDSAIGRGSAFIVNWPLVAPANVFAPMTTH